MEGGIFYNDGNISDTHDWYMLPTYGMQQQQDKPMALQIMYSSPE